MLLPGPPHELKSMFERECLPRLKRLAPAQAIRTAVLRVAGMSESDLDQLISPVYGKYQNPVTTILAANGEIQVHLRARCATESEAAALLAEVAAPIGSNCLATASTPATATRWRWWSASFCATALPPSQWLKAATGGMLGERLTSVPGSSDYFVGGFIRIRQRHEGGTGSACPAEVLEQHGAVSQQTAEAMATGARRRNRFYLRAGHHRGSGSPMAEANPSPWAPSISPSPTTPAYTRRTAASWATASVSAPSPGRWRLDLLRRRITGAAEGRCARAQRRPTSLLFRCTVEVVVEVGEGGCKSHGLGRCLQGGMAPWCGELF